MAAYESALKPPVLRAELRDDRPAEEYASEVSSEGVSSNSGECFNLPLLNPS